MFKENQVAPFELLEQYKKYEYILNIDKRSLIKDLFNRTTDEGSSEVKAHFNEIAAKIY